MKIDQKEYAGLWMDHKHAIFITQKNGEFAMQEKITAPEYHGMKGEHASNNAERTFLRKYYKSVASELSSFDEIFIFGPGKSQEEFQNFLHEDGQFKNKKITLGTSDQLTDNQMVAKVRDHFNS